MTKEEAEKILTHGGWFYINSHNVYFAIVKFDKLEETKGGYAIKVLKGISLNDHVKFNSLYYTSLIGVKELRPITKEEVLKYFPDEVLHEPEKELMELVIKQHKNKELLFYTKPTPPRKRPITRNKRKHILR